MPDGFFVDRTFGAGTGIEEEMLGLASTQYNIGDMLSVTAGIASLVTAQGRGTHIFQAVNTPPSAPRPATINATTAAQEIVSGEKVEGGQIRFKSELSGNSVPPINNVAINAGATTTSIPIPFAGGSGAHDFQNGQLYIVDLAQQRLITDSAFGGGVETMTVAPGFSVAPTVGMLAIAVPWSKGYFGVRFNATTPSRGVDTSIAGKTGGLLKIEGVSLGSGPGEQAQLPTVYCSTPDSH